MIIKKCYFCGESKNINMFSVGYEFCNKCMYEIQESKKSDPTYRSLRSIPEYQVWTKMIRRCHNCNDDNYSNYGGRGIIVCEEWRYSFENFLKDMGRRPESGYSIERIDNNGNYEPNNCRWATDKEQRRNKRNSRFVQFKNEFITIAELSERYKIPYQTILQRVNAGYEGDDLVSDSLKRNRSYLYEGKYRTISEISKMTDMNDTTLYRRLEILKLPIERAVDKYLFSGDKLIEFKGNRVHLSDLSRQYKISMATLKNRVSAGLSDDDLVKPTPPKHFYENEMRSVKEISKMTGINETTLRYRLYVLNMELEHAVKIPSIRKTDRGLKSSQYTRVEYFGMRLTIQELSELTGIKYSTLFSRFRKGKTGRDLIINDKILFSYKYKGVFYTVWEISEMTGIDPFTLIKRVSNNKMSMDEAVNLGVSLKQE